MCVFLCLCALGLPSGGALVFLGVLLAALRWLWLRNIQVNCDRCDTRFTPLRPGKDKSCYKCVKKMEAEQRRA